MKKIIFLTLLLISLAPASIKADSEVPTDFPDTQDIRIVEERIKDFYGENLDSISTGTIMSRSITSDGNMGYYITYTGWVSGRNMVPWNIVGAAQRRAALGSFGYVDENKAYFMQTTQHLANTTGWQTQGLMTVSAHAKLLYM